MAQTQFCVWQGQGIMQHWCVDSCRARRSIHGIGTRMRMSDRPSVPHQVGRDRGGSFFNYWIRESLRLVTSAQSRNRNEN
jgi:hypothetical protein